MCWGDIMKNILNFKSKSEVILEDQKNRMFFHDLINHTHGILLFLEHKKDYVKNIDAKEISLLFHEVKIMQALISEHFKYEHKNLEANKEFVPFSILEQSIDLLFKIYFPESINLKIEYRGKIALFENEEIKKSAIVHYASVYRILNNLIKNMSEAGSTEVLMIFDYNENDFYIETRNQFKSKAEKNNMAEYLGQLIVKDYKKGQGLGLDSVRDVVNELGGEYLFDVKNGEWVNRVKIPHHNKKLKKSA